MSRLLIIDDDKDICLVLSKFLTKNTYEVDVAHKGDDGLKLLRTHDYTLILCDYRLPDFTGVEMLRKIKLLQPAVAVIIITGYSDVRTAVETFRYGANDYVTKPLYPDELLLTIKETIAKNDKRNSVEAEVASPEIRKNKVNSSALDFIVGKSVQSQTVQRYIELIAPSDMSVIINGETGTGKEFVAQSIHRHSKRAAYPFVAIDCGALPKELAGSELFGHIKGAFTGAVNDKQGSFEVANGGTIFLDEIADLSAVLQPKLLRAIEAKEILPVGSTQPAKVDVRIIAATNAELSKACEQGRFREDLYYRLNVINIRVPPLRERREDIAPLIDYLIRRHNTEMKKSYKGADNAAIRILMSLPWRGNIRELDNVLERAMILGNGEWITANDIPHAEKWEDSSHSAYAGPHDLTDALRAYEKMHIENVLKETDGNRAVAAKMLGLSRSSLYRKLESLGIYRHEERAAS